MASKKTTTRTMAQAFDEWMRQYRKNPDGFAAMAEAMAAHAKGRRGGAKATEYGLGCAAMLRRLMRGGKL